MTLGFTPSQRVLGKYSQDIDIEKAIKIARKELDSYSSQDQEMFHESIFKIFNTWKQEHGKVRFGWGRIASELLGNPISEQEKLELFQRSEPWQCAPLLSSNSPIDLLIHLWGSKYEKLNAKDLVPTIATLIIYCGSKNEPNWLSSIVKGALWLTDIKAEHSKTKMRHLNQNRQGWREDEKVRIDNRAKMIHEMADEYIKDGKPKITIVGMIEQKLEKELKSEAKMNKKGSLNRQIRRDLKTHNSGFWKPKEHKKKK